MELLHRRCCGLDVHKETVVACLRLVSDGKVTTEVRTFQTTTADLLHLSEWLAANGCTHVAMEATGVYWKPVWHILDDGEFGLVLANAAHVKNVPGRKTDVNDAMWLAELLAHGLIRASFVPDTQTQEMRNLLRTRKQLVREQSSHVLRVQKTLEDANIKLDSVLTDLMGKSGRAMIEALIAGETNPTKLASLADRRAKASHEEFREALRGRVTKHHRFLLRLHLNQIDALNAAMATLDAQVEKNLGPFRTAVGLIISIPGIKNLGAHVIVSEIGMSADMAGMELDVETGSVLLHGSCGLSALPHEIGKHGTGCAHGRVNRMHQHLYVHHLSHFGRVPDDKAIAKIDYIGIGLTTIVFGPAARLGHGNHDVKAGAGDGNSF